MNRRMLLLQGAGLAVLAPTRLVFAAGAERALAVVHDPLLPRSAQYATRMSARGAQLFTPETDVLALWHGPLRAWCAAQPGPVRITGLTTRTDFLVLRDLARGAGLRTLVQQDPDAGTPRRRATLVAWVLGPPA